MSATNHVLSLYAAFKQGDIPSVLAGLSPAVEWIDDGPANVPFFGVYNGPGEVGAFFQKLDASTAFDEFVVESTVSEGNQVVVLGHFTARNKANGKTISSRFAHVWTVQHDGKAGRFMAFGDTAAISGIF